MVYRPLLGVFRDIHIGFRIPKIRCTVWRGPIQWIMGSIWGGGPSISEKLHSMFGMGGLRVYTAHRFAGSGIKLHNLGFGASVLGGNVGVKNLGFGELGLKVCQRLLRLYPLRLF